MEKESDSTIAQTATSLKALRDIGFDLEQTIDTTATLDDAITTEATSPVVTPADDLSDITVDKVAAMFPPSARQNIEANLPAILQAFEEADFTDRSLVLMALATIRAESANFEPISEYPSKYNTTSTGHLFDKYDNRRDLGNRGAPDGSLYKGRGFIQLTGRANYERYSKLLGLGHRLIDDPEHANDPMIAAKILALFIQHKQKKIKEALAYGDLKKARRLVNGGSHGLKSFSRAYHIGKKLILG